MTPLTWDTPGDRLFQTGVDRGVLYLPDGTVAAWSGLTSVEDASNSQLTSYYYDGVKLYDEITPGDFSGKLKAYTYPDEFEKVMGVVDSLGLSFHDQPSKIFNMSYRTRLGNDLEGLNYGYKLHLLYNLVVNPDSFTYTSRAANAAPIEFAWTISATPPSMSDHRPTSHISINSTETSPEILSEIENSLYGTDTTAPALLSVQDIATLFGVTA